MNDNEFVVGYPPPPSYYSQFTSASNFPAPPTITGDNINAFGQSLSDINNNVTCLYRPNCNYKEDIKRY